MKEIEKVIFDTNSIRNVEPRNFLGGREELKKFSKVAEIIIPDIVIEELKYQKKRQLEKQKQSFLGNPFHWLRNINPQDTKNFDNEAHITELENKEDIKYSVIKLQDYSVLEKIKELALKKLPPFEAADNSDKGFKDAYIYFTVLEYLQAISDKYIFVCTEDVRFKEALQKHSNIKVIKDFEEFKEESVSSFYDEYFINKLKEAVHPGIGEENITGFWFSINGNQILLIEIEDEKFVVEVDKREIIDCCNKNKYINYINDLVQSGYFVSTHKAIAELENFKQYLSDEEILRILEATISNDQIYSILCDDDVKQFIGDLFQAKKETLEKALRENLESLVSNS